MKRQFVLATLIILALLSACGSQLEPPAASVKQLLDTMASGGSLDPYFCAAGMVPVSDGPSVKDSMQQFGNSLAGSNIKLDFSTLKYAVYNQTKDFATVEISGTFLTTMSGKTTEEEFPDPKVLQMKLEDGKWKVCGTVSTSTEPTATP